MKKNIHFFIISHLILLKHKLQRQNLNRALYEIMRKNTVELDRP